MMNWLPLTIALAGAVGFVLAGASAWSLRLGNRRGAQVSARASVVLGLLAATLGMLWFSATVFWPLEYAGPIDESRHPLAIPMRTIALCVGLAAVGLPIALVVLSALRKRGRLG